MRNVTEIQTLITELEKEMGAYHTSRSKGIAHLTNLFRNKQVMTEKSKLSEEICTYFANLKMQLLSNPVLEYKMVLDGFMSFLNEKRQAVKAIESSAQIKHKTHQEAGAVKPIEPKKIR